MTNSTKKPSNVAIEVKDLKKRFGRKEVLNGVSFSIPLGSIAGFLGANGAGKTTALRSILGLISAEAGKMSLFEHSMPWNRVKALEVTGALVESPRFLPSFSGFDNLWWFGSLTKVVTENRIHEVLKRVGLTDAAHRPFGTYSTGMKQRLGVAGAILHRPSLLILDEPTNGMDPQGRAQIRDIIKEIHSEEGTTVFLSSHLLDEVQRLCDYVVIINDGLTVSEGTVDRLLQREQERWEIRFNGFDRKKIREWLSKEPSVFSVSEAPLGLCVDLPPGTSGELNEKLLAQGFPVSALIPIEASLEETFLALTDDREGGPKK